MKKNSFSKTQRRIAKFWFNFFYLLVHLFIVFLSFIFLASSNFFLLTYESTWYEWLIFFSTYIFLVNLIVRGYRFISYYVYHNFHYRKSYWIGKKITIWCVIVMVPIAFITHMALFFQPVRSIKTGLFVCFLVFILFILLNTKNIGQKQKTKT